MGFFRRQSPAAGTQSTSTTKEKLSRWRHWDPFSRKIREMGFSRDRSLAAGTHEDITKVNAQAWWRWLPLPRRIKGLLSARKTHGAHACKDIVDGAATRWRRWLPFNMSPSGLSLFGESARATDDCEGLARAEAKGWRRWLLFTTKASRLSWSGAEPLSTGTRRDFTRVGAKGWRRWFPFSRFKGTSTDDFDGLGAAPKKRGWRSTLTPMSGVTVVPESAWHTKRLPRRRQEDKAVEDTAVSPGSLRANLKVWCPGLGILVLFLFASIRLRVRSTAKRRQQIPHPVDAEESGCVPASPVPAGGLRQTAPAAVAATSSIILDGILEREQGEALLSPADLVCGFHSQGEDPGLAALAAQAPSIDAEGLESPAGASRRASGSRKLFGDEAVEFTGESREAILGGIERCMSVPPFPSDTGGSEEGEASALEGAEATADSKTQEDDEGGTVEANEAPPVIPDGAFEGDESELETEATGCTANPELVGVERETRSHSVSLGNLGLFGGELLSAGVSEGETQEEEAEEAKAEAVEAPSPISDSVGEGGGVVVEVKARGFEPGPANLTPQSDVGPHTDPSEDLTVWGIDLLPAGVLEDETRAEEAESGARVEAGEDLPPVPGSVREGGDAVLEVEAPGILVQPPTNPPEDLNLWGMELLPSGLREARAGGAGEVVGEAPSPIPHSVQWGAEVVVKEEVEVPGLGSSHANVRQQTDARFPANRLQDLELWGRGLLLAGILRDEAPADEADEAEPRAGGTPHPVLGIARDASGAVAEVQAPGFVSIPESTTAETHDRPPIDLFESFGLGEGEPLLPLGILQGEPPDEVVEEVRNVAGEGVAEPRLPVIFEGAVQGGGAARSVSVRGEQSMGRAAPLVRSVERGRDASAPALDAEPVPLPPNTASGTGRSAGNMLREALVPHAGNVEDAVHAPAGLQDWAYVAWRRGDVRRQFSTNVAEATGAASYEVTLAEKALVVKTGVFKVGINLGNGSFGRVDEVQRTDYPGVRFALKTIAVNADQTTKSCAAIEMAVFARVALRPHTNVLCAVAMDDTDPLMPIMLPAAQGDFGSFMKNDTSTIKDWLSLVVDLAQGAAHLHGMGIIHRDIKPGNLLVFQSEETGFQGKLADFGFAREIGEECPAIMGTPGYMAYESMSRTPTKGAAAQDVVGVAVTLLQVCLREQLWCSDLFNQEELRTAEEGNTLRAILDNQALGIDVSTDLLLFRVKVARRTMKDGSFRKWLSADKLNTAIKSPEKLVGMIPSFLTVNPDQREDMDSLCQLARSLIDDTS